MGTPEGRDGGIFNMQPGLYTPQGTENVLRNETGPRERGYYVMSEYYDNTCKNAIYMPEYL